MSNEQNVREYMLNRRIRGLLFHYKKGVILLQFYLVRVFKKMHHLPFWGRLLEAWLALTVGYEISKPIGFRGI